MKNIILAFLPAVFILTGCDRFDIKGEEAKKKDYSHVEILQKYNAELIGRVSVLEEALSIQEAKRAEKETALLLAVSCDYVMPICPESIAGPGRILLSAGVLPNDRLLQMWIMWKAIGLLTSAVLLFCGLRISWAAWSAANISRKVASDRADSIRDKNEAANILASARSQARQVVEQATEQKEVEIQQAQTKFDKLRQATDDEQAKLDDLSENVSTAEEKLAEVLNAAKEAQLIQSRAEAASRALGVR